MKKMSLLTRMRRKIKQRKGQSTVEYVLILAIVLMLANNVKSSLKGIVGGKINKIQSEIENFDE
jgi:hypothetical protein